MLELLRYPLGISVVAGTYSDTDGPDNWAVSRCNPEAIPVIQLANKSTAHPALSGSGSGLLDLQLSVKDMGDGEITHPVLLMLETG